MSDAEWHTLFEAQWFPFAALRASTIDKLIAHASAGWELDEMLDDIVVEVRETVPRMLRGWRNHSSFKPHLDSIERAVEGFQNDDDCIDCGSLLYPRIQEFRRAHLDPKTGSQDTQRKLTQAAEGTRLGAEQSPLLPRRFQHYLDDVYLPNFSPVPQHDAEVSPGSKVQGTATASRLDKKPAVIGILVVHQFFYILENRTNGSKPNESS